MRRIVITGPQPVDMLDLVGPLEVFKFAPEYEVVVASPEGTTELQLNHGFKISDTVPFTKLAAQIDTLVVAGGPGANDELYDDEYLHRIIELASRSRRVAAICTGSSCSQPLDCLTAKGPSPIGPIATSFRGNIPPS